jgi:hypothetical protein
MFAVKGFDQASVFWFSPGAVLLNGVHGRGQSCKTTVEQALMRGLLEALESEERLSIRRISPPKEAVLFGGKRVSFFLVEGVELIELIDEGP